MEENERIWVNPNGLRVVASLGPVEPGGHWEDDPYGDDDDDDDEDAPSSTAAAREADYWRQKCAKLSQPVVLPFLAKIAAPLPCLGVWAGMIATFFWNSYHNMSDIPFDWIVDMPEDVPQRFIAAAGQTAVFLVWTACFRSTIRKALRAELTQRPE